MKVVAFWNCLGVGTRGIPGLTPRGYNPARESGDLCTSQKCTGGKMKSVFLLVMFTIGATSAEPDWSAVEKHALNLLQRYVRIQSVNPPAD